MSSSPEASWSCSRSSASPSCSSYGLKLDLHVVRTLGPVAVVVGSVQVAVVAVAGLLVALGLGLDPVAALYVGIGLALSSTVIVVVKLLSDRQEIDDLHGRLAVGILIVQTSSSWP